VFRIGPMSLTVELVSFVLPIRCRLLLDCRTGDCGGRATGAFIELTAPITSNRSPLDLNQYVAHLRRQLTQQVAATCVITCPSRFLQRRR
jgi:hypothetical protein